MAASPNRKTLVNGAMARHAALVAALRSQLRGVSGRPVTLNGMTVGEWE